MRHRFCKAPFEMQRSFLLQRGAGPLFLAQKPFDRMHRLNSEARGELSAAIAVINASINNDIVRTKVPEPWKPDPQKIDTADPTALEADWEAEVDSMQEWDPTIGEDPTQSGDPGRLA